MRLSDPTMLFLYTVFILNIEHTINTDKKRLLDNQSRGQPTTVEMNGLEFADWHHPKTTLSDKIRASARVRFAFYGASFYYFSIF